MVKVTLSYLIEVGELEGYKRGEPPWANRDNRDIDAEVCAAGSCNACQHDGLRWVPFYSKEHRSYRAFAECPACRHAEEF
ncbi:MAG TPA: hypothetical protein VKD66_03330 [Streptosporangiaceae bacterium]|nr:hypothetical protein [Streptosporangiaceae bacterium]